MSERIDPIGDVRRSGADSSRQLPWRSLARKVQAEAGSFRIKERSLMAPGRAVELLNQELEKRETFLRFKLIKESGQLQAQVVDIKTGETVRKMPPDYLYRVRKSIRGGVGMIVNDEAD